MHFKSLFLASCISITASAQKSPTLIPFSLENNSVYLNGKVNTTENIKFLFDTGADGSVININSKKKVELKIDGTSQNKGSNGVNTVDYSSHNTVQFGDIQKTDVSFTLIPYGEVNFDGVFGTDLMKGKIIEIDYHKNVIRFYDENDSFIDFSGYEKMKLHLIDNYPAVESSITVNDKEYSGYFGLDSGADDALTIASPYTRKNSLANTMKTIGKATAQGSDGSVYEMPVVLCPSITFAHKFLYNVPITLSNSTEGIDASEKMAGFFGNAFLKRFNTIIDFKNQFIYFKLNKNLYSEF
ncbi:retropepsin-like domain-containing protein [Chryseobacterium capnotolerans]|uniref:retropepsin-like aspartic protease n=1 Tax=Chryseobacterium TaxID=59732 RepID=UPI00083B5BC8|nr:MULTISPECIES: retropepsin-like aspartic protease [Chryseobacterium]UHO39963.1 retropepsin-like domain-containing protein [Chryseobacterium capnotolerans]